MGLVTSYTRAKAESLGMTAKGASPNGPTGWRAILVITFFADVLNLPILLAIVLWALAVSEHRHRHPADGAWYGVRCWPRPGPSRDDVRSDFSVVNGQP